MNYYSEFEALESLFDFESDESDEAFESDESDESDESKSRRRRRGARAPKVPSGRGLYKARPQGNYVTQVQLKSAMDRVGAQIKTNADATKAVNTRVNVVNDRIDKETSARKKESAEFNKKLQSQSQMGLLPLLLQKGPSVVTTPITATVVGKNAPETLNVVTSVKQSSDNLLPLVLIMGMSGGGMGGDNNMMLPLVLLMSQDKDK